MTSSIFNSDTLKPVNKHDGPRCLLPVILALAFVILVETGLYVNRSPTSSLNHGIISQNRVPSVVESILEAKLDFAKRDYSKTELIILGDSSGLMGVDAGYLRSETGHETYNLCTIGWIGIEGHCFLLEKYIENHGTPSVVIYHFAAATMTRTEKEVERLGFLSRVKRSLGLERHLLPSMGYRRDAQEWIVPETLSEIFLNEGRGKHVSHINAIESMKNNLGSMKEVAHMDWISPPMLTGNISPYQFKAIQRLINLSQKYNFSLFLIANPLPEIAQTDSNREFLRRMEARIVENSKHYENVHVHKPFARYYDNTSCATLNHLHPNAIRRNTKKISDWLASENKHAPQREIRRAIETNHQ